MTEVREQSVIVHGDYLVDENTGEIVGLVHEPFKVNGRDTAEWVLEKLSDAEAAVASVQARRKVLLANLDAMEAEHQRRADWLRYRFEAELREWASAELNGKKQRSIKTPFGTIAFRRTPGKVKVLDEDAAVEWARANAPGAVKETAKVLVSMLDPAAVPEGEAFHVEGPGESFTIKTGLL